MFYRRHPRIRSAVLFGSAVLFFAVLLAAGTAAA